MNKFMLAALSVAGAVMSLLRMAHAAAVTVTGRADACEPTGTTADPVDCAHGYALASDAVSPPNVRFVSRVARFCAT